MNGDGQGGYGDEVDNGAQGKSVKMSQSVLQVDRNYSRGYKGMARAWMGGS